MMNTRLMVRMVVCGLLLAGSARAMPWLPVLPQNDVQPATFAEVKRLREDIDTAMVVVEMGEGEDNPRWMVGATQLGVMLDTMLQFLPQHPLPEDDLWPKLPPLEPRYKGLRLLMQTVDGKRFAPISVFEGRITGPDGTLLSPDYGRRFEFWLFGTTRVRRDQLLGARVLPVLTFEQCRLLGQRIVNTTPRQCLLPDNNIMLESMEMPTLEAAKVRTFDECLQHGKALIYTFPRRCLAAGGRVFTEPPKVYEQKPLPADAPLADEVPHVSLTVPQP